MTIYCLPLFLGDSFITTLELGRMNWNVAKIKVPKRTPKIQNLSILGFDSCLSVRIVRMESRKLQTPRLWTLRAEGGPVLQASLGRGSGGTELRRSAAGRERGKLGEQRWYWVAHVTSFAREQTWVETSLNLTYLVVMKCHKPPWR